MNAHSDYRDFIDPYSDDDPDRYFNKDPSPACDIWSYMCIFSTLWCGISPFRAMPGEQAVSTMVDKLGLLLQQFKGHCIWPKDEEDSWYIHTSNPLHPGWDLEGAITKFSCFASTEERKHVLLLMYKCFRYLPDERPTATQRLQDLSFKAIMNMYC